MKQELLTPLEHYRVHPRFFVSSVLFIFLLFCVVFLLFVLFVFVLCLTYPMLPVSLYYPFFYCPFGFSLTFIHYLLWLGLAVVPFEKNKLFMYLYSWFSHIYIFLSLTGCAVPWIHRTKKQRKKTHTFCSENHCTGHTHILVYFFT